MNIKYITRLLLNKMFRQKHVVYVEKVTKPYVVNLQQEGRFKDKVVVITGGAGAIGRATACRLAIEGGTVIICGRNLTKLDEVAQEILKLGSKAESIKCDVTNEQQIQQMTEYIVNKYGRIDFWCNIAGGGSREKMAPIDKQETSVFDNIIHTNLTGTLLCCKYASKAMKLNNYGKIINTGSTVGIRGLAEYSEYATAKAAVIALTESLAMELGKYGITVNCVTPGIVQRGVISDDKIDSIRNTNFLNSYCTPEDIASMTAFLLSDEANFITGQNFIVDGGRSLGMKGC